MLFLSGLGAGGAGPSGWTRIAPWMRTTGETGASKQEEVRAVSQVEFLCPHPHLSTQGLGASMAVSSPRKSTQPVSFSPPLVPGGGWTRGCKRMVVLGGTALGGIGTVVITTGLGCRGGFRVGRALPEGRKECQD